MGSPLATYSSISASLSGANTTLVVTQSRIAAAPLRRQIPVSTSCRRPESSASMRRASAASAGLARISPSITTVVSAPSTISPSAASMAYALAAASLCT